MDIQNINDIFISVIKRYHVLDDVNQSLEYVNSDEFLKLLEKKSWIDTVQWHLEDIIRDTGISSDKAISIKRFIDKSNQDRTNVVERLDDYFLSKYKDVIPKPNSTLNTESPAWAIDRLSILALKIYHMEIECSRDDAPIDYLTLCKSKLKILLEQRFDLMTSISELFKDYESGDKKIKVYRQMKMYNDNEMNPILRKSK